MSKRKNLSVGVGGLEKLIGELEELESKSSILKKSPRRPVGPLFEEDWKKFKSFIGKTSREIRKPKREAKLDEKLFIFSCLHIPFQREDLFVRSVEEAVADGCKIAVIAGDFLDCYGMCSHKYRMKQRFDFPLQKEVEIGQIYLEYLSDKFDHIYILLGNHLDRVRKFFAERVGPGNLWLVRYNLIEFMTEKYGNFTVVNNTFRNNEVNWLWRHGDLLVTHREKGSTVPLRPTLDTHSRMQNWQHVFGFKEDYRCLVQVHTHLGGTIPYLDGKYLLFEGMCLCEHPQYSFEATLPYPYPQVCGYTIVSMNKGKVDFRNSYQRFFQYDERYPDKKV
jgi:hypothetical protein